MSNSTTPKEDNVATGSLPTCISSGVFFRFHCRHEQLFRKEYKRSNRNQGMKILRCFPHCCPHHVERSYCGTSLELALDFQHPDLVHTQPTSICVFARFEPLLPDSMALHMGECASLRGLQAQSQGEINAEAAWVQGVLRDPSTTVAGTTTAMGTTSCIVSLNGQSASKWYYHWESGANKSRRLTKHVLRAYVFGPPSITATQMSHNEDTMQLISTIASSPFTMISYRRAAWENPDTSQDGMVESPNITLQQMVRNQVERAFEEFQVPHPRPNVSSVRAKPVAMRRHSSPRVTVPSPTNPVDAKVLKQEHGHASSNQLDCVSCRNLGQERMTRQARAQAPLCLLDERFHPSTPSDAEYAMRDLAIVYYFLSHCSLGMEMEQSIRIREQVYTVVERHWHHKSPVALIAALFPPRATTTNDVGSESPVYLPLLLPPLLHRRKVGVFSREEHRSAPTIASTTTFDDTLAIIASLAVWAVSTENIQRIQAFFEQHCIAVLDRAMMQDAFHHCTQVITAHVQTYLDTAMDTPITLYDLSEDIISMVHQRQTYRSLWQGIRRLLEHPQTVLWPTFVAQMREVYMRKYPPPNHGSFFAVAVKIVGGLQGEWVLNPESLHPCTPMADTPSIGSLLLGLTQLLHITIKVTANHTFHIHSKQSLLPSCNPWMNLICDRQPRVVSVFPMGLSSLWGLDAFGGDYVGSLSACGTRLYLELYWWPLPIRLRGHQGRTQPVTRVCFTVEQPAESQSMQCRMDVQHSTKTPMQLLHNLETWTPRQRVVLPLEWQTIWSYEATYCRVP